MTDPPHRPNGPTLHAPWVAKLLRESPWCRDGAPDDNAIVVRTPEGTARGVSFEQEEISARSLEPDAPVRTELRVPEALRLEEGIPISWEDYRRIETGLLDILRIGGKSFSTRLVAGEVYLGLLSRYLGAVLELGSGDRETSQGAVVEHFQKTMVEGEYSRPLTIAGKIKPALGTRRIVLAWLEAAWPVESSPGGTRRSSALALWLTRIARLLRPRRPTPLAALDREAQRLLEAYTLALIWRKALILERSGYGTGVVRRGYAFLVSCLVWAVQSAREGRWGSFHDRLRQALGRAERQAWAAWRTDAGPAPLDVLSGSAASLSTYDRLSHHPGFTRSMVGPG